MTFLNNEEKKRRYDAKMARTDSWTHLFLAALAALGIFIIVGYGIRAVVHWVYTKDAGLPSLVTQIQTDIKKIDDQKNTTGWEVAEAEVEVNFVVKDSSKNGTELKAVTSEIGSEREDSHRLLLKLHRVTVVNGESSTTPDTHTDTVGKVGAKKLTKSKKDR